MTSVIAARRPETGPARPAAEQAAGGRALIAYLSKQRDAVRAAEGGVRYGDAEAVHDMRVATRRLRSTLRSFRADLRPWQPLRDELKWLATALGDVRDGDVMGERLAAAVTAQPPELVVGPVAARLAQRVARETAGASTDAARHEARKAYKRARYAVEMLRPVAGRPATRLRKRLTVLQDVLGAHRDAVITAVRLREHGMRAYADGENAFTYGLLLGRQQRAAELARERIPRARRRAGTAKVRGWLDG